MTLLSKKMFGVGLTLLGGLIVVHGASAGRVWETLLGQLALTIGVAMLAAKIAHPGSAFHTDPQTEL